MPNLGEVNFHLTYGNITFIMNAIVVKELQASVLGGMPFLTTNGINVNIKRYRLEVRGQNIPFYNTSKHNLDKTAIRNVRPRTVFPGDYMDIQISHADNPSFTGDVVIKPIDLSDPLWPEPQITTCIDGHVRLENSTPHPISLRKHQHVAQIMSVEPGCIPRNTSQEQMASNPISKTPKPKPTSSDYSADISVDPDNTMTTTEQKAFVHCIQSTRTFLIQLSAATTTPPAGFAPSSMLGKSSLLRLSPTSRSMSGSAFVNFRKRWTN